VKRVCIVCIVCKSRISLAFVFFLDEELLSWGGGCRIGNRMEWERRLGEEVSHACVVSRVFISHRREVSAHPIPLCHEVLWHRRASKLFLYAIRLVGDPNSRQALFPTPTHSSCSTC